MNIDFSKIKPGDKITVEFEVSDVDPIHTTFLPVKVFVYGKEKWIPYDIIVGHTPKPIPKPKVGDKLRGKTTGHLYTLIAANEQEWVLQRHDTGNFSVIMLVLASDKYYEVVT
jgi:hypothetical protein